MYNITIFTPEGEKLVSTKWDSPSGLSQVYLFEGAERYYLHNNYIISVISSNLNEDRKNRQTNQHTTFYLSTYTREYSISKDVIRKILEQSPYFNIDDVEERRTRQESTTERTIWEERAFTQDDYINYYSNSWRDWSASNSSNQFYNEVMAAQIRRFLENHQ